MSLLFDISPADLGLPERFSAYRPGQAEAIDHVLSSDAPVIGVSAPTGLGKSLIACTVAKLLGAKAVYLTATKGLQSQILSDFEAIGMCDIRGRANYPCRHVDNYPHVDSTLGCDLGEEEGCPTRYHPQCPYIAACLAANASRLVSTNYAYWLHARRQNANALGKVELLILDEAHEAPEQLASFLRVTLAEEEAGGREWRGGSSGLMNDRTGGQWKEWARREAERLAQAIAGPDEVEDEHQRRARQLREKLLAITQMNSNWVWEADKKQIAFEPVSVAPYAAELWGGVPKVLLLSATLRPYTLELLGLKGAEFIEFENGWPAQNAPILYLPCARLSHESTEEDYRKVVARIDEIIEARWDRKGLIHTVSYQRMHQIRRLSRYAHRMLSNDGSSNVVQMARLFRSAEPPAILLSPSFSSGWDFPGAQCEYQILPKVPFPPAVSRVMQERLKDPRYRTYLAMLEVTQMIGRARRFAEDRSETFLLDSYFPWLFSQARPYAPRGFRVQHLNQVPKRPPRAPEDEKHAILVDSRFPERYSADRQNISSGSRNNPTATTKYKRRSCGQS